MAQGRQQWTALNMVMDLQFHKRWNFGLVEALLTFEQGLFLC
jgi:hypothetical protein